MKKTILFLLILFSASVYADTINVNINLKDVTAKVSKDMYGIFFEDINFGADGGLYAEMVKNRSFEFPQHLMGWKTFGNVELKDDGPFKNNPHYVELIPAGHRDKVTGLENEGFRGMGFKSGADYRFSVWARTTNSANEKIRIEFINTEDDIIAKSDLTIEGKDWKKYTVVIKNDYKKDIYKGILRIFLASGGNVDLEHVSLFPVDTWRGHENGLRKDLAQKLYDLHPGFMRFPGGCIVEGTDLATRYDWKKSVGQVENRPLNQNRWNYTFPYKMAPDYFQSYGMGFFEFFQLCEEIGAQALPVVNCGMACQFQNDPKDTKARVAVAQLSPYVNDALDLIEFANGDVNTKWGKVRSDMGHPAPFNLKYIAVGNEQWGELYPERLEPFVKAIREKYPEMVIIGSSGPSAAGKDFEYGWGQMRKLKADLVDEHYYMSPDWFYKNAGRYDNYDRKGPKVFAGEYASHDRDNHQANDFLAALSESAFMTGLERNADVVRLSSYAPLFANVDAWQWRPDLIWFNSLQSIKTPNYYVQQLYAHYKGTDVISTLSDGKPLEGQDGLYASSVIDADSNTLIIKIVNNKDSYSQIDFNVKGLKDKLAYNVKMIRFRSDDLKAENTFENPNNIVPETIPMELIGNKFSFDALSHSFTILVINKNGTKISKDETKKGLFEKNHKTVIFTIGDSTVKNGDGSGSNGQWGWGSELGELLDNDSTEVINRALGGRSSRSYQEEGLWNQVLSRLQPGDYVLMQFGHNDGGEPNSGRARATIKGIGDETKDYVYENADKKELNGKPFTLHTYGYYMKKYVEEAKAKGAIPVMVTLIPRNNWNEGKIQRNNEDYALWARQIAEQENIPVIDLNNIVSDMYDKMGEDAVKVMYYGDHTHTSLAGAKLNAEFISKRLKEIMANK